MNIDLHKLLHWLLLSMLLAAAATPASAQIEGSLFTTPEERAYLDFLRQQFLANSQDAGFDIEVPEIPVIAEEGEAKDSGPIELALGGIMTRRDGSRSVWLNNQLVSENDLPSSMRIVTENQLLSLRVSQSGRNFLLKPGQSANFTTGEIVEIYQLPPPASVPEAVATPPADSVVTETAESVMPDPDSDTAIAATETETEEIIEDTTEEANAETDAEFAGRVSELSETKLADLIEALQEVQQEKIDAAP